jgi:signal-transduction protein with cAMP-binding, CBS, and nucleotidyltransferase domain
MNELPEITRFLSELPGFEELDQEELTAAARAIQIGYYKSGSQVLQIPGTPDRRLEQAAAHRPQRRARTA